MQHSTNVVVQKLQKKHYIPVLYKYVQYLKILILCTHLQQLKWGIYQLINYCHLHLIKFSVIIDIIETLIYTQPQTSVHESLIEKEQSTTTSSLQKVAVNQLLTNFITEISVACSMQNFQLAIVDAPNGTSEGGQEKLGSSQKRAHWELQENPRGAHTLVSFRAPQELLRKLLGSSQGIDPQELLKSNFESSQEASWKELGSSQREVVRKCQGSSS